MIKISEATTTPKDFELALKPEMEKPIEFLKKELLKIRTGRANPSMIENVRVQCYGSDMGIKELAAISAPDARLLVVQPWDKTVINNIEKALQTSDLGITPINDGDIIRIQLPNLSSERREEFIKILHKKLEECRIAIRNVRKEFQNAVRDAEKDKDISIDYSKKLLGNLQDITDKYIASAEDVANKKELEIKS
ncbi:MAG: ribosome recycling factor [Candidatus Babeliales bacterium]|nr:ribosome recycling factor [Candidatus Babeliales bacterium]